jgi:signal transduction histidine kinase
MSLKWYSILINLEIIGQMSDSLASTSPEESMLSTTAETIARTVKLPYMQLETAGGTSATYGAPVNGSELTRIEITYRQESVGWLEVTSRLPKEGLSSSEYSLLNSLARQVGITLHAARLSEALQASREQLVTTREEERRRIRRDLHDGLGPTLASLRMQLSALRRIVHNDPDLQARYQEIRQRGYDGFAQLIEAFAGAGVLTRPESPQEQLALTELCWIVSEQWPVNLELSGRAFDATGIQAGVALMRHIFRPYLLKASKGSM